ncbi:MAG: hypothetical protein JSS81_12045 [Acidobacteria bacterium]|nr:hypothetical protein [Acidobacteriota bacterium]
MKFSHLALIILIITAGFSCLQKSENRTPPPVEIDKSELPVVKMPTPAEKAPPKIAEIYPQEKFSNEGRKTPVTRLEIGDYRIERKKVVKTDDIGSPPAEIFDAVLTKNGQPVHIFEGVYVPLGNQMSFGFYPFLGGKGKQLLVFDQSLHYERDWIVRLTPKFEILYDTDDFGMAGRFALADLDRDGIYELMAPKLASMSFSFSRAEERTLNVVFKYDPERHKYLPATEKFPEIVLQGFEASTFDEQLAKFESSGRKTLAEFLQIFLKLVYAGREAEAWKFHDQYFSRDNLDVWEIDRDKNDPETKLRKALEEDEIYRFIIAEKQKQIPAGEAAIQPKKPAENEKSR